jgi:hypothetical protein
MTFTITGTITRCAGLNHYQVPVELGNGVTGTLHIMKSELEYEPASDLIETRERMVARMVSAGKELNAVTFAQWRTALELKTFKL